MKLNSERLEGIGGWLLLVALFVIAAPFVQLAGFVEGAEGYKSIIALGQTDPLWAGLLGISAFVTGVFLAWACFNVYLFFSQKVDFKKSYISFLLVNSLFLILDTAALVYIDDSLVSSNDLIKTSGSIFGAIFWSLYIYRSERVRNTFVRKFEGRKFQRTQTVSSIIFGAICLIGVYIFAFLNPEVIDQERLQAEAESWTKVSGGQMLDEITRADKAEAVGMTLTYSYTLINGAASEFDADYFVIQMRPDLLELSCNEFSAFFKAGVTVQYAYAGNDGLPIATFGFTGNDCPQLEQNISNIAPQISAREIATRAKNSFVSIGGYVGGELTSTGSGFILREDGVLVTNLHVLQDVEAIKVEMPNGEIYERVFVLGVDELRDLALLQIPATRLPALPIGDDSAVEVGDTIYTLGNPLGFEQTFTDGILSARRVTEGIQVLQISAPISPGSSGGPVLNGSGQVIGVVTAFMQDGQNLNLAMPAHYVNGMLTVRSEPKVFEELVGTAAFSASETVADRNREFFDMLESFPDETRAKLEELEPAQQQVMVRSLVTGGLLEKEGWKEIEIDVEPYVLKSDEQASFNLTLDVGNYFAIGVCDNDCTDLDMVVVVEGEEPLTDNELDAEPGIPFDLSNRASVVVHVGMVSCTTKDCFGWILLYRK